MTGKRLYKSSSDKVLFGVCGGIAEYFDVDPVIIRLLVVVFALTGAGILFYIFAAVIIGEKPEPRLSYGRSAADASFGAGDAETYGGGFPGGTPQDAGSADGYGEQEERPRTGGRGSGAMILGLILIIIGLFYMINRFIPIFYWIDLRIVLAVLLVMAGIYFVAKR
jgi:phage shock protein PspC (stress-responsive transcriptional regulator)